MIDDEVRAIVEKRMESVILTLHDKEKLLHKIAERLLEKETIEAEEFFELLGEQKEQTSGKNEESILNGAAAVSDTV
jgi:ATP-dependent Zn protease